MNYQDSDIEEKVFLNENYQIVDEKDADYIRLRLKNGNVIYGTLSKSKPAVRVMLKSIEGLEIVETTYMDIDNNIVPMEQAEKVKILLKNGQIVYGGISKKLPKSRVILKS